jgi:hypothetical protein
MTLCIIPSALEITSELQEQFGNIPNVLIPLESKAFIDYIATDISINYSIVSMGCHKNQIEDYVKNLPNVSCLSIAKTSDLAETILCGIEHSNAIADKVIVNFGDTFINEVTDLNTDTVFFSQENDTEKWTSFTEQNGIITEIIDKKYTGNNDRVFVGKFCFNDVNLLTKLLKSKKFYIAVQKYSETHPFTFVETTNWIDIARQKHLLFRIICR